MIWNGRSPHPGGSDCGARHVVSVSIDLPDRGRPRRCDVGDHLAPYVGRADRTLRGVPAGAVRVDLNLVWPSPERPWTTAYTVGASSRPMTVPPELRSRCSPFMELFLRLPAAWVPESVCPFCVPRRAERDPLADPKTAWPFEWLARLARLPHLDRTFLGRGHVVECGGDAPVIPGTAFSGFYLDAGWDEAGDREIPPLVRTGGERVEFFGVIPLHAAEVRSFRGGRGSDVLRALDDRQVTELLDPGRPCSVPGGAE
jgi:hypothetical protein